MSGGLAEDVRTAHNDDPGLDGASGYVHVLIGIERKRLKPRPGFKAKG